jgi:hypothetical protein
LAASVYTPRLSSNRNVLLQSHPVASRDRRFTCSSMSGAPRYADSASVAFSSVAAISASSAWSVERRNASKRYRSRKIAPRTDVIAATPAAIHDSTHASRGVPSHGPTEYPTMPSAAPIACAAAPHGSSTARPFVSAPNVIAACSGRAPTTTW